MKRSSYKTRRKHLKYDTSVSCDIAIVGGGIAGLYCAFKLSKTHKVYVFDERSYIGGRIYTHELGYEVGAARFNNSHKRFLELIDYFTLTPIPLPKNIDYVDTHGNIVKDVHETFDALLQKVLHNTTLSHELRNISFYDLIVKVLKSQKMADTMVDMFGYHSEIKEMNGHDAYVTFKNDFGNVQYFILKEGLSTLRILMKKHIEKQCSKVFF